MTTSFKKNLPSLPIIFISLFIAVIAVSCGGGGGGGAPAAPIVISTDQDAQGLYTTNGDGDGTFKSTGNPDVVEPLTDIKGMVYGDLPNQKFIFFDVTANVLYQGEITTITLTDFVGTATVYHDGVMVDNLVTVSGAVVSRSNISMTLAASGNFAGGTIEGLFLSEYDKGATNARIESLNGTRKSKGAILMKIPDMTTTNFDVGLEPNEEYSFVSLVNQSLCFHTGTATSGNSANIYTLLETVTNTTNCTIASTDYKGFASVVDGTGTDTRLWYAVTNGTNSIFAILDR